VLERAGTSGRSRSQKRNQASNAKRERSHGVNTDAEGNQVRSESGLIRNVADDLSLDLEHGRLTISRDAVAEIVAATALACYGVVGLSAGTRVGRILRREGISVEGDAKALRIELHVVVEHGLNLAEVASTVRSQVGYDVDRLTGLRVAAVEVVIQRVRASA
jgi:uncharacterized alkaline shock family protein YloU